MKNQQLFFGAGILFLFFSFLAIPSSVHDAQTFAYPAAICLITSAFVTHLNGAYRNNVGMLAIRMTSMLFLGICATIGMILRNEYVFHLGDSISFHKIVMFYTDLAVLNSTVTYFFQKVEVIKRTK